MCYVQTCSHHPRLGEGQSEKPNCSHVHVQQLSLWRSGQTGRSAPPDDSIFSWGEGARPTDWPDSSAERNPFDLPSSWFMNTNWWGGTKHPDAQPAWPPGPQQSYVLSCRADSTTHRGRRESLKLKMTLCLSVVSCIGHVCSFLPRCHLLHLQ